MDLEARALENLDLAFALHDAAMKRDIVDAESKDADFYLRAAQIYATLSVAQQISRYPSPPSYIEVKR